MKGKRLYKPTILLPIVRYKVEETVIKSKCCSSCSINDDIYIMILTVKHDSEINISLGFTNVMDEPQEPFLINGNN